MTFSQELLKMRGEASICLPCIRILLENGNLAVFFYAVTHCNKEGYLNTKGNSQKAMPEREMRGEGSRVRSFSLNEYMLLSPILLCIFFINQH